MAELTTTKLNAESHLILEQPLLRLPHELSRRTFKSAQRAFERDSTFLTTTLRSTANASLAGQSPAATLSALDAMIARMQTLKRKMISLHTEELALHQQSRKRIQHLRDLYSIPSLADVKYDEWSRVRLNRLLVDYLLRMGYVESARALAQEKGIEDLVDLEVFVQCGQVEGALRGRSTGECLAWCAENKAMMRKGNHELEFQLRFQQFIELRREGKFAEARQHASKYLAPHEDTQMKQIKMAAGLFIFPPNTPIEPYKYMYSQARWDSLADLFVRTHHELFSLPVRPLLHIALSAGLSVLKTPSCHSAFASSSSNASSSTTTVCPICSTELNELARDLPFAHHSKSYVENDPVVLPNGRVYGYERLMQLSAKSGLEAGVVKDPTTGEVFGGEEVKKVYIS